MTSATSTAGTDFPFGAAKFVDNSFSFWSFFSLAVALSLFLWITASDYPFGISQPLLHFIKSNYINKSFMQPKSSKVRHNNILLLLYRTDFVEICTTFQLRMSLLKIYCLWFIRSSFKRYCLHRTDKLCKWVGDELLPCTMLFNKY